MRNEIKILIAAIVVIIIVLVGAFALGGTQNGQAGITPTPVVLTPTPTPTPIPPGGNSVGASAPTPSPSVAPTVTPSPTPTPTPTPTAEPASGRKLTEFGYWITYPPLGPQTWSNPHAPPRSGNNVYFSPTSQTVTVPVYVDTGATSITQGAQAIVHRDGNLSGTTVVGIYVLPSDNMYWPEDYHSDFSIVTGPNMTWISYSYFKLTFGPGVSEQTINIRTSPVYEDDTVKAADDVSDFSGTVKLDIVEVDDGYHIGSDHMYTLNVVTAQPTAGVQFISNGGYLDNETYVGGSGMGVSVVEHGTWEASITLTRSNTAGSLSPHVSMSSNVPGTNVYISQQPTFNNGQSTATLKVIYTIDTGVNDPYATFTIDPSPSYSIGSNNPFHLDLYMEW